MPFLVLVVLLSVLAPASTAQAEATPPAASIGWSVPKHFGSRTDARGLIVEDRPSQVRRGPWPVELEARGSACQKGARYRWSLDGTSIHPKTLDPCRFRISVPHEGPYKIGLVAAAGGKRIVLRRKIIVQDLLIVSIGDSVASGEGVPDVPDPAEAAWQSRRCHRSARAGPAVAAREIENDDRHTSVTFVHLACSGATVHAGLIGPYDGVESNPGEPPLPAQVEVLNRLEKVRPVDAVLVSIGANDVHFGEIVRFCALAPRGNCFAQPFDPVGPADYGEKTAAEVVAASVAALPNSYGELNQQIDSSIPRRQIHFVEYFDPTGDSDGKTCEHGPPGVSEAELEQARDGMLAPLNLAVAAAVEKHGWDEVRGVAAKFRTHGYCSPERWVNLLSRSFLELGGSPPLKRLLGTLHPNRGGQTEIGEMIATDLEREFFPGRHFIHPPTPAAVGGSGFSVPTAVPVLAGLLAALLLLLFPRSNPVGKSFWDVVSALGRAFRPLLLPLFVVFGVGAISFGWLAEALVAFAAVILAWFLIGRPMLREIPPRTEGESVWTRILLEAGGIILAAIALWLAFRLTVDSNAYFKTVGGVTSGLLTFSLVLWALAVGLRLVCFAESWLRALIAALVGAALLRLTVALGILPGEPGLQESVPAMVRDLLLLAGGLLLLDGIIAILKAERFRGLVGRLRGTWIGETGPREFGAAGSTAAFLASVVLLVAVSIGLFEAAERGKPLHPPEGTAVDAKRPEAAPGAGDRELNRRYAPVLAFTKEERWSPISVDSYLHKATLYGPEGAIKRGLTLEDLDRTCPGGHDDCYHLTIECESGREECAEGHIRERDPNQLYREGAVYVRGPLRAGEHPGLFPNRGPFREELRTLIQYWYFYYYDEWRAPVFAGVLTQKHEGDWEVVTLGLDAESRPLFVGDSAHCGGSWRRWREIEASTKLPGARIHPLVAVAEGSHANYPDPEQKRTSDPGHCAGLPEGMAAAISYASNIRDKTEYGWAWYPPKDGWLELRRGGPNPMVFPGTWGASDRTTLTNFNVHEIGKAKAGPKTPSLQPSWTDPVGTIFCGRYRRPVGSDPETFNC